MNFLKILFIISSFYFSLLASEKINVLILHSYTQEYPWTKSQHNSFVQTLKQSKNSFEFNTEYLNTKRLKLTTKYEEEYKYYLDKKYEQLPIDIVYATDDNALLFIYKNYKALFKDKKNPPVFFSGINDLNMKNTLPKDTFVGVYEVKEIEKNIELIKQFSPQTREIYFIGDNSKTYNSIKKVITQEEHSFPKMNFHYISDEYISNILENLPTASRSFVFLTTIGNLKDDTGNTLLIHESINQIAQNKNLILLTMEDSYMYPGVVGGCVTNGLTQGKEAAKLALAYIKEASFENIHSLEKSPNSYVFNSKELVNSRVILSEYIARDALIIGKNASFTEKNQSTLLNIFTLLILILIFSMVLMYAILNKKNNKKNLLDIEENLNHLKLKLNSKDQFINTIMSFDNIAYWRLDTKTEKLFLSQNLLDVLAIDSSIYKDDSEILSYFIHENDKTIFQKNMLDVKENKKSVTFTHKMISSQKKVLLVKHIIYSEYLGYEASDIIIGIIKFED